MAKGTSNPGQKAVQNQRSKFTDFDADASSGRFDDELLDNRDNNAREGSGKKGSALRHNSRKSRIHTRPRIDIPYSQFEVLLEVIALIGVVGLFAIVLLSWSKLPEQIPSHFGATGLADDWSSKKSIWLLPGFGIVLYIILTITAKFPHTFNFPWPITEANAEKQYQYGRAMIIALKAETIALFAYIEYMTIQVALGKATGLGILFLPVFLGLVFGTIFICLFLGYKAR